MPVNALAADRLLRQLDDYDCIVDARSQSEYALDRLPGAVNWPTLNDEQRAIVGTEYKQVSPFDARKRGAAMAARNIAAHIDRELTGMGRDWRPLVYCWRGGKRSGSLALVLDQIGFKVDVLEGGYQAFRRAMLIALDDSIAKMNYRVLCGTTGSGKSRLLNILQSMGEQVLDLEALAEHRGSVLGLVPGIEQPSQKAFDTRIWDQLRRLDPERPVWVESESKKVGALRVPETLISAIRKAACWRIELNLDARVRLLMEDYDFFVSDIEAFCERLDGLRSLRGNDMIDQWQLAARSGGVEAVVRQLLVEHYDPIYLRSIERNFAGFGQAVVVAPDDGSWQALRDVARKFVGAG